MTGKLPDILQCNSWTQLDKTGSTTPTIATYCHKQSYKMMLDEGTAQDLANSLSKCMSPEN